MQVQQILFVEDDVLISYSSCGFLRDRGLRVIEASTASAAVTVLERLPYLSALVTDVDLGAGENGFDVARRMRASYPGVAVIFVSGTAASRHKVEGVEGSIFIAKPYHPRQIEEALLSLSPHNLAA